MRAIAQTLSERNIGAILWAGSGDMSVSYAGDQAAVAAAPDTVIASAREFGLPAGLNGNTDLVSRVEQGVRMFVSIGVGSQPPSQEDRRAVGR